MMCLEALALSEFADPIFGPTTPADWGDALGGDAPGGEVCTRIDKKSPQLSFFKFAGEFGV